MAKTHTSRKKSRMNRRKRTTSVKKRGGALRPPMTLVLRATPVNPRHKNATLRDLLRQRIEENQQHELNEWRKTVYPAWRKDVADRAAVH